MQTTILFVRHGETAWNRIKRIQGHTDIPLSEHGVRQAQRLAARLRPEAGDGPAIDAVISSDLSRAAQTAQPVAQAWGVPLGTTPRLRERSYGAFEGLDRSEIRARFPDDFAQWQSRDPHFAPPGGESFWTFYERTIDAVRALLDGAHGKTIVCVAHGGVLDCVYRFVKALPLHLPRDHALLNASINEVRFDAGLADRGQVVRWADVDHLSSDSEDDSLADRADRRAH
jgi:probable phosphoglycerate mutase